MISENIQRKSDIKSILAEKGLDSHSSSLQDRLVNVTATDVERALATKPGTYSLEKLTALVSPAAENYLEQMAQDAHNLTLQRFGKTIKLYAPLYLSNDCINSCLYCGFNKETQFPRTKLTLNQAAEEAAVIASEGFRDILLVASEDRTLITIDYLVALVGALRDKFSSISVEIYQLTTEEYARLFKAGIEGVTIYQETYDRQAYAYYHPAGPKADYEKRLSAPDCIAQAGMRQVGLGVLLGLTDWRLETLALGEHAHYLMKRYWKSHLSFSFPRLRPAYEVQALQFKNLLSDTNLTQMILALRLCFADAGLVISTRESARLRDSLVKLGITKMSAGSKTNPGGYSQEDNSVKQFEINDSRSPAEVAQMLRNQGIEPVWKDWDAAFIKGK
ncbi:MAG: 2-iminoacetate synthase ThiH [Planctomycetota bacterium]|jgi:2-iminoacetate synthase